MINQAYADSPRESAIVKNTAAYEPYTINIPHKKAMLFNNMAVLLA